MLAISSQSVCGVEKKGQVYCWGLNNYGQLGDGTSDVYSAVPRPIASAEKFKQVAHNYTHGCALTNDGRAFCWGANETGQLGSAAPLITRSPTAVSGGMTFSTIAVGAWHSCAIRSDPGDPYHIYCWGANAVGQLGTNTIGGYSAEPIPADPWGVGQDLTTRPLTMYKLSAGLSSNCALQEGISGGIPTGSPGRWVCWGYSAWGLFGGMDVNVPVIAPTPQFTGLDPLTIRPFTYEDEHLCIVAQDPSNPITSTAFCAGRNSSGQYGNGTDTTAIGIRDLSTGVRMTEVQGGMQFNEIVAGTDHTCALKGDGTPFCWGGNDFGQLGTGDLAARLVPVPVSTTLRFAKIYAANRFTCALTSQGEAYCWGRNEFGELGDGAPTAYRPLPTRVAEP
jgi:alpha-tubulin suppressor-like RCC1 family protein